MNKLPNKPSALIRVAVADLKKVERSKRYIIDMGEWHCPIEDKCAVCVAGSVIAKTLKVEPTMSVYPGDFDNDTEAKLDALNEFKDGFVGMGFDRLGIDRSNLPDRLLRVGIPYYHRNRYRMKEAMLKLARNLEAVGF